MRTLTTVFIVVCLLAMPAVSDAGSKVILAPLKAHKPPVGVLVAASDHAVTVVVRDERPDKTFVAASLIGPGADKDKGIYFAYGTQNEEDLARFLESASRDALAILGVKEGGDYRLEIVVRDFYVGLTRVSGFGPMNCFGYGRLTAVLKGPDGAEVKSGAFDVAFFDTAVPKVSFKEISDKALSAIYSMAAWQVTATMLRDAWKLTPDPAALEAAARIDKLNEDVAREVIFWLGLVGKGDDATIKRLLPWSRTAGKQKVHETAAVALGMLGVGEAREFFRTVLGGKETGEWDADDYEHVWHLVHAMALLGEKDLGALIPKDLDWRIRVEQLVAFLSSGALPAPTPEELKNVESARKDLAKQRKAKQKGQ